MPEYVSRYFLHLEEPYVNRLVQEVADFTSGMIIGTLVAMLFRWWAFKKWVFPDENGRQSKVRRLRAVRDDEDPSQRVA